MTLLLWARPVVLVALAATAGLLVWIGWRERA